LDLCQAYNFPTGLACGGGVIGILELGGGWTQADLDTFSQLNGLPQIQVTDVPLDGANTPGQGADAEVLLDIQVSAAAYFYATGRMPTIKVFWAKNDFSSFQAVINAAVNDGCDVLSISWGADEVRWIQGAPGEEQHLESVAQAAAESGLVVFSASGDNSSGDSDPGANVDVPSACPHVIGCGGTRKERGVEEVVWGDGTPNGQGTGGGFSKVFPMPTWQLGAPSGPGRMVPDVAANADPNTGYLIVLNGQEVQIGGTSAVAPLYAGLFAAFGPKLGFVTPKLWQNPSAFVDIIHGSNGQYSASVGPDPCTGLGVPNGVALAALFCAGTHAASHSGLPRRTTVHAVQSSTATKGSASSQDAMPRKAIVQAVEASTATKGSASSQDATPRKAIVQAVEVGSR